MKREQRLLVVVALAALAGAVVLAGWFALVWRLLSSELEPAQRSALAALLQPQLPLFVFTALLLLVVLVFVVQWMYRRWAAPAAELLEQARLLAASDVQRELVVEGSTALRGLAETISQLARQRQRLQQDIEQQVAEASRDIEQERNRLAALMSELTQSVVVCNLDARVLLYNNRARAQFRELSSAPQLADGAELIGLGRSIHAVFDRKLVAHALDTVQQRLARGAANPSAQFVTITAAGQLLRVQMAPVRAAAAADGGTALAGFVLMLDNITRDYEADSQRDQMLYQLTEASRGSLANLQAALEILDDPALDAPARERFLKVVRDEGSAMSARIRELAERSAAGLSTRWPLEDTPGADLVAAAQRRIEHMLDMRVLADEVDAGVWLRLDSFSLLQALSFLAARLRDDHEVRSVQLRLQQADAGHAHLDLLWSGQAMSTETAMNWEIEPMHSGDDWSPLSVRDVIKRHGGEFWFERERVRQQAFFRFLLPLASEPAASEAGAFVSGDSRPEFYDFDLFRRTDGTNALDERRLADLAYTVFDTETTGLDPRAGDEIIQIGAVRVLNGKLLRAESFEQLVDPQRPIPAASIPIHGIQPEMLVGKPTIAKVLPAFHAYAQDTVLVAHNAAFDMRFLQLKEASTGVRFEQPVLDTLLLSALVHPNQESHGLEAIAERFDVKLVGRHTALGDALATAEIFVKLLPLLAGMGIHTLAQAREAAQKTFYARVKY